MSITYNNTPVVTSGMIMCLDAANPRSYPGSGAIWNDISGYENHTGLAGSPAYSTTNKGQFTLDGSSQGFTRNAAMTGVTTNCTVAIWYSSTDTQELWTMGNGSTSWYLCASANNNYYNSNCGAPSNYIDLNSVINPATPDNYRNGAYHMWEAKTVDFTAWTRYDWFLYPGGWQLTGNVAAILVYNRVLSAAESAQNFSAYRGRYGV
jgi:hypothetical protein